MSPESSYSAASSLGGRMTPPGGSAIDAVTFMFTRRGGSGKDTDGVSDGSNKLSRPAGF